MDLNISYSNQRAYSEPLFVSSLKFIAIMPLFQFGVQSHRPFFSSTFIAVVHIFFSLAFRATIPF